MEKNADIKKLGIILAIIVGIIFFIIIAYLVTVIFGFRKFENNIPTTTTTRKIDEGYSGIRLEEKININSELNDRTILIAFNNAFDNNYNLRNVDLFETEISKFKFIYTYLKLNDYAEEITFDIINKYSTNFFDTGLYANNFSSYLKGNYYEYEIKYDNLSYCLKAVKQKDNYLLIDMLDRSEEICDVNVVEYDSALIIHQLRLKYKIINNDYIYKSFVVVK